MKAIKGNKQSFLFTDADNKLCSIQDSSLADESIWFGVHKLPHPSNVSRMHLTREMAKQVATILSKYQEGQPVSASTFLDRNGNTCGIMQVDSLNGQLVLMVGIIGAANGDIVRPMRITPDLASIILPYLLAFVSGGSIFAKSDASCLDEVDTPVLDVKIPQSMIGRTDIGESGISAQKLIDSFLDMFDHYGEDMRNDLGYDKAVRIEEMVRKIRPLV